MNVVLHVVTQGAVDKPLLLNEALPLEGRRGDLGGEVLAVVGVVAHEGGAVGQLGLDNVAAVQSRAESYVAERGFATVIARAVATIPQLIDWAGHLVDEAGIMLALKGRFPHEELAGVPQGWSYTVDPLDVPGLEQRERHVVILKRRTE